MLSRTLTLAAVALWIGGFVAPAAAQNLEAGKSPSQIFTATCSLCHKSSRGLLKTVAPSALAGFLRQHYTTSSDMASALSAYVLSNGASDKRIGEDNLTREGKDSRTLPKPGEAESEPKADAKGKPGRNVREAKKPEPDDKEAAPKVEGAPAGEPEHAAEVGEPKAKDKEAKDKKSKLDRRKPKSSIARGEPQGEIKKPEASPEMKPETKPEAPVAKPGEGDTAKIETGTRPDPVPAVTPAPAAATPAAERAPAAKTTSDAAQKTDDDTPTTPSSGMPVFNIEPAPAAPSPPSEPPRPPAGPPVTPISR